MSSQSSIAVPVSPSNSSGWPVSIQQHLSHQLAKKVSNATPDELFRATSAALRPRIIDAMLETEARFRSANAKSVYYLSMEFLLGRSLRNNLQSLNLYGVIEDALADLGLPLADL